MVLVGITYGIEPYGGHTMGWTNPSVLALLVGGLALLALFVWIERQVRQPDVPPDAVQDPRLRRRQRRRPPGRVGRGGLQFMLIIWLQGIWLPLHGYSFAQTPLWAGIYMLPLTGGLPRRRAHVRVPVGPLRRAAVRHRRDAAGRRDVRRAHAPARELLVPGRSPRSCS